MDHLLFQYCQKIVLFSKDGQSVLLAKRQGEQDYNGAFSLIGGKMETTDVDFVAGLKREKNEEIGEAVRIQICPMLTNNVLFTKKNGSRMILPHYIARYIEGEIVLSDEYSEYAWVPLRQLASFEPKIETIPAIVEWASRVLPIIQPQEWTSI